MTCDPGAPSPVNGADALQVPLVEAPIAFMLVSVIVSTTTDPRVRAGTASVAIGFSPAAGLFRPAGRNRAPAGWPGFTADSRNAVAYAASFVLADRRAAPVGGSTRASSARVSTSSSASRRSDSFCSLLIFRPNTSLT